MNPKNARDVYRGTTLLSFSMFGCHSCIISLKEMHTTFIFTYRKSRSDNTKNIEVIKNIRKVKYIECKNPIAFRCVIDK